MKTVSQVMIQGVMDSFSIVTLSFTVTICSPFFNRKPLFPSPSTFQPNSLLPSMLGQREEKALLSKLNSIFFAHSWSFFFSSFVHSGIVILFYVYMI